eukprot:Sdes_comp20429_c0_seq1m14562
MTSSASKQLLLDILRIATFAFRANVYSKERLARLQELKNVMHKLTIYDFTSSGPFKHEPHQAPVLYTHLFQSSLFSMGIFFLRAGESLPLHDHPGMTVLRYLYISTI